MMRKMLVLCKNPTTFDFHSFWHVAEEPAQRTENMLTIKALVKVQFKIKTLF